MTWFLGWGALWVSLALMAESPIAELATGFAVLVGLVGTFWLGIPALDELSQLINATKGGSNNGS